jgi:hypothetical protein
MCADQIAETPASPLLQLCERAKVGDEAKALLSNGVSTKDFIALLVQKEMFKDGLKLLAHLLPKREAVGWGCLCVKHALAEQKVQPPEIQIAVERWVAAPSEENRWAAKQLADEEEPRTASGLLAMGAFLAGPSLAAPHHPQPVPPPEKLTSVMVANAVLIAGIGKEPKKAKEKYAVFMQKGTNLLARMQQQAMQRS